MNELRITSHLDSNDKLGISINIIKETSTYPIRVMTKTFDMRCFIRVMNKQRIVSRPKINDKLRISINLIPVMTKTFDMRKV